MKVPCEGCQERRENCHAVCEKYKKYKEAKAKAKRVYHPADQFTADMIIKQRRRKK